MNTLEMLGKLMENPKRKAKITKDHYGHEMNVSYGLCVDVDNRITWDNDLTLFIIYTDSKTEWEIIEPKRKLKEMCFGEAYHEYATDDSKKARHVESVLSGLSYDRSLFEISREEMMGKWTIEGIYEDESEDK